MKWIEVKMKELGVSTHSAYRICFMIDSLAMISVHTPKYGVIDVSQLHFFVSPEKCKHLLDKLIVVPQCCNYIVLKGVYFLSTTLEAVRVGHFICSK